MQRCKELAKLLCECNFPAIAIHSAMPQEERCVECARARAGPRLGACAHSCCCCYYRHRRCECSINRYKLFKEFNKRILVATDLFGRGMDIERVNIVINYDMPSSSKVGRFARARRRADALLCH